MKDLKAFIIFVFVISLTIIVLFRVMNAMQNTNDATLVLAKEVCPIGAAINEYGSCTIHGTLSHNFVFSEVEVTLPDNTTLMFDHKYLLGYSRYENSVTYKPFGKWFAFMTGISILLFGWWLAIGAPTKRSVSQTKE